MPPSKKHAGRWTGVSFRVFSWLTLTVPKILQINVDPDKDKVLNKDDKKKSATLIR